MKARCTRPQMTFSCTLTAKIDSAADAHALAMLMNYRYEIADWLLETGKMPDDLLEVLGEALGDLLKPLASHFPYAEDTI